MKRITYWALCTKDGVEKRIEISMEEVVKYKKYHITSGPGVEPSIDTMIEKSKKYPDPYGDSPGFILKSFNTFGHWTISGYDVTEV